MNRQEREAAALSAYQEIYTQILADDYDSIVARIPESVRDNALGAEGMRFWILEKNMNPASAVEVRVEKNRAEIRFPARQDGMGLALFLESSNAGWWPHSVGMWATEELMDRVD